jgi:molecular chaperone DnaK (HSP70)
VLLSKVHQDSFERTTPVVTVATQPGFDENLVTTLTRAQLEESCDDLIQRTLDVVRDVLLDAKLKASELDEVILVGGQSRMPLVREKLYGLLGKNPHRGVNADEAVAQGAALLAGTVGRVGSVVLIDVLPVTIGMGVPGGNFQRVLERNTSLPAQTTVTVTNNHTDERICEVFLFQGEDKHIAGNEYLGTLQIHGVPPGKKGKVKLAITLKLDAECQLAVTAKDAEGRDLRTSVSLQYSAEELQRRLQVSKASVTEAQAARATTLRGRGGRFWSFLKSAVGVE